MKKKDYFAVLDAASNLVTMHVPHMGYADIDGEVYAGHTENRHDLGPDFLSPALRTQFEDVLGDACHLMSLMFRRAAEEGFEEEPEEPPRPNEVEEPDEDEDIEDEEI